MPIFGLWATGWVILSVAVSFPSVSRGASRRNKPQLMIAMTCSAVLQGPGDPETCPCRSAFKRSSHPGAITNETRYQTRPRSVFLPSWCHCLCRFVADWTLTDRCTRFKILLCKLHTLCLTRQTTPDKLSKQWTVEKTVFGGKVHSPKNRKLICCWQLRCCVWVLAGIMVWLQLYNCPQR